MEELKFIDSMQEEYEDKCKGYMTPGEFLAYCSGFALVCMGISLLVMSFKSK